MKKIQNISSISKITPAMPKEHRDMVHEYHYSNSPRTKALPELGHKHVP